VRLAQNRPNESWRLSLTRSVRGSLSLAGKRKRLALLDKSFIPGGTISASEFKERWLT
jgi:hypothetical protein